MKRFLSLKSRIIDSGGAAGTVHKCGEPGREIAGSGGCVNVGVPAPFKDARAAQP